jgi:glutathione S-transferase
VFAETSQRISCASWQSRVFHAIPAKRNRRFRISARDRMLMLKLYYSPGACSIAAHIALREADVPFELHRVDLARHTVAESGRPYREINPKGYVPALELDDGQVLTEAVAILQYVADLKPEAHLAPAAGTFARVRLQEWLNFIATELHKGMGPLISKDANDAYKHVVKERVASRLDFLAKSLEGRSSLLGEGFTVADAYLVYALRAWKRFTKEDIPADLRDYFARLVERPTVRAAMEAENITA